MVKNCRKNPIVDLSRLPVATDPEELKGLVGANAVRERLGKITSGVLSDLVRSGRLLPVKVNWLGWKYFDPVDVERFAATYTRAKRGEPPELTKRRDRGKRSELWEARRAAKVFSCFKRCMSLPDIVAECMVTPDYVRRAWTEYTTSLPFGEDVRKAEEEEREAERRAREYERQQLREEFARLKRRELDLREKAMRAETRRLAAEETAAVASPTPTPTNGSGSNAPPSA